MYVIIDDTTAVTVNVINRVTTDPIATAAPVDNELESTSTKTLY